ncbi:MAG: hypothetical protein EOL87_06295 [Spartobacteria bacterium]|nr:hypothetical protein [Spartobacteria bacterium]
MTPTIARRLACAICRETVTYETLKTRGNDVLVARTSFSSPSSVIIKLWNRPSWKGSLRRYTKTNIAWKEWSTLQLMHKAGIKAPYPYSYLELGPGYRFTEAIIMGDLGECHDVTEYIKRLLRELKTNELAVFERAMIRSTASMIKMGLIDIDHRLPNFVVSHGRPVRLDFELTRQMKNPRSNPRKIGIMLGTFIGSYLFAVQPNTKLAESFTRRLFAEVKPSNTTIHFANKRIQQMLDRQKAESGINTKFTCTREK